MSHTPRAHPAPCAGEPESKPPRAIALGFELRLITKVGILLGAGALVPVAILWLVTSRFAADTYFEVFHSLNTLHMKLIWVSVLSAAGQLLLVGALVSAVALYASHRIAGPLIRLEHSLRELAHGNLTTRLQFRSGDQDQSLPGAFEALRQNIVLRVATARESAQDLRNLIDVIRDNADTRTWVVSETEPVLRRLMEHAERLKRAGALGNDTNAP